MEAFLNRYRNLTVLLLVVAAQVLLLGYQVRTHQDVRLVRVWAVTAVTPLARVLEFVRRNTIGIAEDYFVLINVRDENNRLGKELGRLKLENQFLRTELQTADRARALAAFQSRTPSRTIAARVIGSGTGTNSRVVFVDRGSSSGVERGMAVITPEGIVGKVLASYPTASQVLLITDPNFAAGVISQKNRIHGTVKGKGQSKLIVDYVQNEEKVEVGEVFYTSGDDRIFPKGMPVGTVSVVRDGRGFKEIYLVPTGTQNGLEEVLIVIEGVHAEIPDAATQFASSYSILPPPPGRQAAPTETSVDPMSRALATDADRIRDRYKKIGEVQNHTFGEGTPGSRPPNFNIDPDKAPKPSAPAQTAPRAPTTPSQIPVRPPPITGTSGTTTGTTSDVSPSPNSRPVTARPDSNSATGTGLAEGTDPQPVQPRPAPTIPSSTPPAARPSTNATGTNSTVMPPRPVITNPAPRPASSTTTPGATTPRNPATGGAANSANGGRPSTTTTAPRTTTASPSSTPNSTNGAPSARPPAPRTTSATPGTTTPAPSGGQQRPVTPRTATPPPTGGSTAAPSGKTPATKNPPGATSAPTKGAPTKSPDKPKPSTAPPDPQAPSATITRQQ